MYCLNVILLSIKESHPEILLYVSASRRILPITTPLRSLAYSNTLYFLEILGDVLLASLV